MSKTVILGKPSQRAVLDGETLDRLLLQVCIDGSLGYEEMIHSSVRVLHSEGAQLTFEALLWVVKGEDPALLKLLFDLFPEISTEWLSEALLQAIIKGKAKAIRVLLDKGAIFRGSLSDALGLCGTRGARVEVAKALGLEIPFSRL